VRFLLPLPYRDALAFGKAQLLVRVALEGVTAGGQLLASELLAALEIPRGTHRCDAALYLPPPAPQFHRVDRHVFLGGALAPLDAEGVEAPVYSAAEVQQFALLDGLVTLALLGVDDYFKLGAPGFASTVALEHLLVVRTRSAPAYGKLRALADLGLAYRTDPATSQLSLAADFSAVCADPPSRCVVSEVWADGEVRDAAQALRVLDADSSLAAFVDSVPPPEARGSPEALAARAAFTDTLFGALQPDGSKRAVYLINTRQLSAAPGEGVEYVLLLTSYSIR